MDASTTGAERFTALMAEYDALDKAENPRRAAELLVEAGSLVDREHEPKKWAAFRYLFGQFSETIDAPAAILAYRDALTKLDPDSDRELWVTCHSGIGSLMVNLQPCGPEELDEAIVHLEHAVGDQPFLASLLAVLYRFRTTGDPWDNWRKRLSFLESSAAGISKEDEPVQWAQAQNEIGVALLEEPDTDFNKALKERINRHCDALAALADTVNETWIDTCLYLSECYLFFGEGDLAENLRHAERFGRDALAACTGDFSDALRAKALLGLVRVTIVPGRKVEPSALHEGLVLCDEAARLIDSDASPALMASVESIRANIYLKCVQQGETAQVDQLLAHVHGALDLLIGAEHIGDRRSILQVAGEGLLAAGRYEEAVTYLQLALSAGEIAIAEAGSNAGRMERIWEFRDSSALLSYCLLRLGRIDEALWELDRGKGRFWQAERTRWATTDLRKLVPADGALLFAQFASIEGAVVVMTGAALEIVWLPEFGREQVMQLQRGGSDAVELGGWLKAYNLRNDRHAEWRETIDSTCRLLYTDIWLPLCTRLEAMGITPGAELVWFPQGGVGILPIHAAWCEGANGARRWLLDEFTIRYAPSVSALLMNDGIRRQDKTTLMVVNPTGDLESSELECGWIKCILESSKVCELHGGTATEAAVLEALGGVHAVHFATHALFDINRPLKSCLFLAGGARLELEWLIPMLQANSPDLAVLSACETGFSRVTSTPDEFLGFPAAFLHAGARSVLATLWPVDDAAAALLTGRFYLEIAGGNLTPAAALRAAQIWIRKSTVSELRDLLRELKKLPSPAGVCAASIRTSLISYDPETSIYAEPYFWAAFTISGKE